MKPLSRNRLLAVALVMMATSPAYALKSDTEQPIHIAADQQELDIKNNIVEFSGNVILTQGSINIRASRIILERKTNQPGSEVIRAFGSPTTFAQKLDDGGFLKAQAKRIIYTTKNEYLQMLEDARLEQSDSTIKGNAISYRIDQQKLVAESEQGGRVTTIIQPQVLQKEN